MHIFNWGARKEKRQIPLGPLCAAHQTLGSDFPFLLLLQFVLTVGTAEAGHTHTDLNTKARSSSVRVHTDPNTCHSR